MNFEKALDENFDGFIAKGNNNFIEIILDGQGTFFVCLITVRIIIKIIEGVSDNNALRTPLVSIGLPWRSVTNSTM